MLLGHDLSLAARVTSGVRALLRPNEYPAAPRRPKIVAHRGDVGSAPENTRAACEAALAAGADGLELDLCMTKDHVAVLWHDADPNASVALYRQSGVDGACFLPSVPSLTSSLRRPVIELTYAELSEHFGYIAKNGERGDCRAVERLEDIAPWLAASRCDPLFLDAKLRPEDAAHARDLANALVELFRAHPALGQKQVHVFTPEREIFAALRHAFSPHTELAELRLTADFELPGVVETAQELGARHVGIGTTIRRLWPAVRDEIADAIAARERGLLETITIWTVEDRETLAELFRLGVDAVLTDDVRGTNCAFEEASP